MFEDDRDGGEIVGDGLPGDGQNNEEEEEDDENEDNPLAADEDDDEDWGMD